MNVTSKISVDLLRPNVGTVVHAIQGDSATRCVRILLLANGQPWVPPDGVETAVSYLQPTMHKGLYNLLEDGTPAVSVTGNVVEVILAPQMLTQPGTVRAALMFNDPRLNRLTSFPFTVCVARNPAVIDQQAENYIRLQWMEDQLQKLLMDAAESGAFTGPQGPQGEVGPQGPQGDNTAALEAAQAANTAAANANGVANSMKGEIASLKARMDTFTSLPEGSTTGDAELMDIRIKADGSNAPSAGAAVREQISELNANITNICYDIYSQAKSIDYTGYDANRSLSSAGKDVKEGSVILSYPVTEGTLLYVKLKNFQDNPVLFFFQTVQTVPWDSNTNIVGGMHAGDCFEGYITVPDGASYLITNTDMSATNIAVKNIEFVFNEDNYMAYKNTYSGDLVNMKVGTYAVSSDNVTGLPTKMTQKYGWLTCYVPNNLYILVENNTPKTIWLKESSSDWKNISYASGKLSGKRIAYNGDSICESRLSGFSANGGAYAKLISDITGCTYDNRAVSGGTLAISSMSHCICNDISNMPDNADLICLEGGINDYWLSVPLGTYSESDYTSGVDKNTVCGALESILRESIQKWPGKPICFVLTHKIKDTVWTKNPSGEYTFQEQHEKMIGILNKYSIPYYDCFTNGMLNGYIDSLNNAFLNGGSNTHPDGTHPDESGYMRYYVPQLISLFESILPN